MDLNGERSAHLGTIGGNEPANHRNCYVHSAFDVKEGQEVEIAFTRAYFMRILLEAIESKEFVVENSAQIAE